jgi:nucleotide-binding universal stress UspA family protein
MLSRILIPLDGSPFSEAAIPVGVAIARRTSAVVRLLHVVEVPEALSYPEYRAEDRAWATSHLSELATQRFPVGIHVDLRVREGRILKKIDEEASAWKADLIVMTTHGRGGVSRLWMGSVADRCVRSSAYPVLLVRPSEPSAQSVSFRAQKVVVPLDGSPLAEAALPHATAFAKAFGASVLLVRGITHHGTFDIAHLSLNPRHLEAEKSQATVYLDGVAGTVRAAGITVETVVLMEPGLAEAIVARGTDEVIVMTTNGAGGLDRAVFGSVADKVVRSASCPVLVIRPERNRSEDEQRLTIEIAAAAASVALPPQLRG